MARSLALAFAGVFERGGDAEIREVEKLPWRSPGSRDTSLIVDLGFARVLSVGAFLRWRFGLDGVDVGMRWPVRERGRGPVPSTASGKLISWEVRGFLTFVSRQSSDIVFMVSTFDVDVQSSKSNLFGRNLKVALCHGSVCKVTSKSLSAPSV